VAVAAWLTAPASQEIESPGATTPLRQTALFVRYSHNPLPIVVQTDATLYALKLLLNPISDGFYTFRNGTIRAIQWPTDDPGFLDMAMACTVSNHGDVAIMKVALRFNAEYRKSDKPNVLETIDIQRAPEAALVHSIEIPVLEPKESFTFIIVNTTALWVAVCHIQRKRRPKCSGSPHDGRFRSYAR
jgi:hypothetical protein